MYVLNRKFALRSTQGRIMNFEKGVPTYVPPQCEVEAVAIGAEIAPGETAVAPNPTPDESILAPKAPEGDAREEMIVRAFKALQKRNERTDFTAAGYPSAKAVTAALGFPVDKKEVARIWVDYREREAA